MTSASPNGSWLGRPEEVYLLLLWFPTHYSVLVNGPPGVGKFEYLLMQARDSLSIGERVVFVTLDIHPDEIRLRAKALGLDLTEHEGDTFAFVDCYSAAAQDHLDAAPARRTFLVSSFSNLEGIDMAIHKAAQALGPPVRIFVYSVSTLFLHNSGQAIG
ncbi:MAG: RAD55 family ATPase, partial [Methanobacteriota archaeon]